MVSLAPTSNPYETKTQEIARQLLAATRESGSFLDRMKSGWGLEDKLLGWAMGNPGLRVQLFRFIDCLPALRSPAEVARHLREYLADEAVELPDALKQLMGFAAADSIPGKMAGTTISKAIETLAYKYIAGKNLKEVTKTVERLRKEKMAFTIDLLGEAVISEAEADAYREACLTSIDVLTEASQRWHPIPQIDAADGEDLPKVQISVKLTAFYSQFHPFDAQGSEAVVSDRIRILLRRAAEAGAAVHFDMEQIEYKTLTFEILKRVLMEAEFRDRTDIGVTLQGYLRESERDLQDLVAWAKDRGRPMTVRLVKGAYWDRETIRAQQKHWPQPVFNKKSATDANYERLTRLLLENHEVLHAAIGSHNVRSQALACAIAEELNVPRRRFEMQVLYGMGEKLAKALVARGHRVRVYCSYGELLPGMAYLIRRLLENTANSSFLRQSLEDRPSDELLAVPDPQEVPVAGKSPGFEVAADTDFAIARKRREVGDALAQARSQLGKTYLPLIAGEPEPTEKFVDSVNPSQPAEIVGKIGLASIEQADRAIAAAKAAFPAWKRTPATERAAVLRRAGELMAKRRAELTAWMCLETGKIPTQADPEVSEAIDFCRYYAAEMERLDGEIDYDVPGESDRYHYQPRGITLVVSPWNFPLAIPTGMTVASLVAGNCTLLKPAAVSSVVAAKIAEILVEAGVPNGVFQYVPSPGSSVGAHLVRHPDINTIVFTGSQEVGCQIYAEAARLQPGQKHLKRVIAEMGGKNAVIVDESADVDAAVAGVVQSAFGYSGQKCSACSRAIVLETVYDAFLKRAIEATRSLRVGDAAEPSTTVGPVIDAAARQRIRDYIAKGKQTAEVALEMAAPDAGYFVGPTIFKDVSPNDAIAREEIFGPVLAVLRAKDFDEALAIANDTNYALTGGLYSRTPSHIQRAKEEFEVGNLYINRGITGAIVGRQPFGGFKLSGVGSKAGGPDYVQQFLEPRTVTENVQRHGFAPIEGAE